MNDWPDVLLDDLMIPAPVRAYPLTWHKNQGKRKRDKWGLCRHCGVPCGFKCKRCGHWICMAHVKFRKVRETVGTYRANCFPKCVLRKATP